MRREIKRRTSPDWCNCGFKARGKAHEAGFHHLNKKSVYFKAEGIKTNVGDPLNNKMK
jgi:hypothetical protein